MTTKPLQIEPIPAFDDNYIWLIHRGGPDCAIVDPGDHEPVQRILAERSLSLRSILITHHHWDHAGGVASLLEHHDARVFGPDDDRLGDWCQPCREGDQISLEALGLTFGILDIPAHTSSHIAFFGHGLLFSGDTLFSIGCGRLFEGTAADMQRAMDKIATLPGDTQVYCGHEYTQSNCSFALQVEPDNAELQARSRQVNDDRCAGRVTLPSRLAEELAANPFMRTREPAVVEAARGRSPDAQPGASTLGVIRDWKDQS